MEAHEERLCDEREQRLVRTVVVAIVVATFVIAALTTIATRIVAPDWGWLGALGVGAMAGGWTSAFAGGTAGTGLFQAREERAARRATADRSGDPTLRHAA